MSNPITQQRTFEHFIAQKRMQSLLSEHTGSIWQAKGEIMAITAVARRTIQQWVHKYNKQSFDGLRDKPRPGTPTKLPRKKEVVSRKFRCSHRIRHRRIEPGKPQQNSFR